MTPLQRPLFYVGHHYVTVLGLIAFVGFFAAGLIIARFLQSQIVRRSFSRLKVDTNFIAIVTTILSLAAIVFFTVTAVNAAGIPLAWTAPLPAITLSLVQIFLLIALLVGVFWFSSGTKRFLFNRLLAQSGLDRSLQYAIAQVVSNIVLVVGIFLVLENTGIHLAALAVFAGAVGVAVSLTGLLLPSATITVALTAVYASIRQAPLVRAAMSPAGAQRPPVWRPNLRWPDQARVRLIHSLIDAFVA